MTKGTSGQTDLSFLTPLPIPVSSADPSLVFTLQRPRKPSGLQPYGVPYGALFRLGPDSELTVRPPPHTHPAPIPTSPSQWDGVGRTRPDRIPHPSNGEEDRPGRPSGVRTAPEVGSVRPLYSPFCTPNHPTCTFLFG